MCGKPLRLLVIVNFSVVTQHKPIEAQIHVFHKVFSVYPSLCFFFSFQSPQGI